MTEVALALVLASTITHAWWNFLLKRAGGSHRFVALSKGVEVVLLLPLLIWTIHTDPAPFSAHIMIVLIGAVFVLLNYASVAQAYSTGNLSTVYPVSRGGILIVLPILGYLVFAEELRALSLTGMLLIVCGMLFLPLTEFRRQAVQSFWANLTTPATGFALLAAIFAAFYTVWDKRAVNTMPVIQYFYSYTFVVAAVYLVVLRMRETPGLLAAEWRNNRRSIISVSVLNSVSYLMVLFALRSGVSSTVIAVRQLSIAWSVALGVIVLREPLRRPALTGALLILVGCGLTALDR